MKAIGSIIKSRRTIHQFKSDEVPSAELIMEAIDHAVWAPNHHLSQPWHFYLLGADSISRICKLNAALVREKKGEKAAELKLKRWQTMPGWLVLSVDLDEDEIRRKEDYAACCCAAQNMALFLWEQGIGVKWTTGAVTRDLRFFDILGIDSACQEIVGLFWYGYPEDIPAAVRKESGSFIERLP